MWVTSGSHLDCAVGQWIKWVNKRDPAVYIANGQDFVLITLQVTLIFTFEIEFYYLDNYVFHSHHARLPKTIKL